MVNHSGSTTGSDDDQPDKEGSEGHDETVDPAKREEVLNEYGHRCQVCGRCSPENGGLASLEVHHIERDLNGRDEHGLPNLSLLCASCHSWFHQQSPPEDAPVEITPEDQTVLRPPDTRIIQYLAEHGPARTGAVTAALSSDLTSVSVRERLWKLMGLDNMVESRDRQIVDKNIETKEWGLVEQIEQPSARGNIPDDPQVLLKRAEDEMIRRALDRGCDRGEIVNVFDVTRRTTFAKQKRACAYDFPLSALTRGGSPDDNHTEQPEATSDITADDTDVQQRLDTVDDEDIDSSAQTEAQTTADTGPEQDPAVNVSDTDESARKNGYDQVLRGHLQDAIRALREVEREL